MANATAAGNIGKHQYGVYVNARDRDGSTALALALAEGKMKAAQFLREAGAAE